jgi:outer membrane murein-binding lipoprotein Lpp
MVHTRKPGQPTGIFLVGCVIIYIAVTGCSRSGAVDQLAVENAKLKAENALLRSENDKLKQQVGVLGKANNESSCIKNLRRLDGAVSTWALENRRQGGDQVVVADIDKYVNVDSINCPSGGHYTFGTVDGGPKCSVHGGLSGTK